MAQNAANVLVGADGFVLVGDLDAPAPTASSTLTSLLAQGYEELGYISTEGVTESGSTSTQAINAWQRNARVRTVTTEGSKTFAFTMIETNKPAVEFYYGTTVAADGSLVQNPGASSPRRRLVIGVIDGEEKIVHFLPDAQATERGDITYTNSTATGRPVTVSANDDATIGGSVKTWISSLAE